MSLRIIQVGMGGWGQNWAAYIVPQVKEIEPRAWVDLDADTLAQARERLSLPVEACFLSLEEALEKVECDAVLITASLPGHVPNALLALHMGKHVLMEKPFAPSVEEARQVVELAEKQGRVLMISQNYRFHAVVRAVTEAMREQIIGPAGFISLDFRHYANSTPREGNRHYQLRHPLLLDMSIHHFDLMRLVPGQEAKEVVCTGWNPPWSNFVDFPAASATIGFANGAQLSYRGSWISTGPQTNWSGEWRMECEGGEIEWSCRGDVPQRAVVRPLGKRSRSLKLPELHYIDRAGSLDAFAQAVINGSEPECSGRDNLDTLALMFAAIESVETHRPVSLTDPTPRVRTV